MNRTALKWSTFAVVILGAALWLTPRASAQADPVARGEYLVSISGCITCHTPFQPQFADLGNIAPGDLVKIGLSEHDALDLSREMAGGRPFDLGPEGVIFSSNLTPDSETGLGAWTDAEIKAAIRTGASRDGSTLHPIMPYAIYNNMAESDLDAIIAYLRTLPAVNNPVPPKAQPLPFPPMPAREGLTAPDAANPAETGQYLMTAVLPCTHCHTPLDNTTGQPIMEKYLAGGQPYEGPWGIVYAANLTPSEKFGLKTWTDPDIRRVLSSGVRNDGRRLVLMPWQDYAQLTEADAQAVVAYLRQLAPVDNEVPKAALEPAFVQMVELPATQQAAGPDYVLIGGIVAAVVIVGGGAAWFFLRKRGA